MSCEKLSNRCFVCWILARPGHVANSLVQNAHASGGTNRSLAIVVDQADPMSVFFLSVLTTKNWTPFPKGQLSMLTA